MKKSNLCKKLFSAILSIIIILGSVSAVSALTEAAAFTKAKLSDKEVSQICNDNLLRLSRADSTAISSKYQVNKRWNTANNASETDTKNRFEFSTLSGGAADFVQHVDRMTDGDSSNATYGATSDTAPASALRISASTTDGTWTAAATENNAIRMIFYLGETKNISNFLISWNAAYPVQGYYNIYLANATNGNIYSYNNNITKVVSSEAETGGTCNRLITLSAPQQANTVVFEFTYNSFYTASNGLKVILLTELGAYESVSEDLKKEYAKSSMTDESVAAWSGSSLLKGIYRTSGYGSVYQVSTKWNTTNKVQDADSYFSRGTLDNSSYWPNEIKRLTDGSVKPTWAINTAAGDTQTTPSGSAVRVSSLESAPSDSAIRFAFYFEGKRTFSSFLIGWNQVCPVKGYNIYVDSSTWVRPANPNATLVVSEHGETEATCNRLITLEQPVTATQVIFEFTLDDFSEVSDSETVKRILLTELAVYSTTPETVEFYSVNNGYGDDSVFTDVEIADSAYVIDASANNVSALRIQSTSDEEYNVYLSSDSTTANAYTTFELTGSKLLTSSQTLNSGYIIITGAAAQKVGFNSSFAIMPGDLSGNGLIQADDLAMIRKELLGNTDFSLKLKDANEDGSFNIIDLVNLKKKA